MELKSFTTTTTTNRMIICGIRRCNSNNSVFAFTYLPRFPSGYCQFGCTARTVTLMQFISSFMFSKLYLNSSSRSKKRKSTFEPEQKFKIYPEKKRIKKIITTYIRV